MLAPSSTALKGLAQRLQRYWFLGFNLAFWLVTLVAFTAFLQSVRPGIVPPAWFVAARLICGILFCSWVHGRVEARPGLKAWRRFIVVLGLCAVFAIIFSLALQCVLWAADSTVRPYFWHGFFFYLLSMAMRLLMWANVYSFLLAIRDLRRSELLRFEQERSALRMQLRSLNEAFQPHFLMNGLNAIVACRHDPNRVLDAATGLADYLRYATERGDALEPLHRQLHAMESYLTVQDLRFGDALSYRQDVDAELLSIQLPRYLLQPLVENAFKYGSSVDDQALQVSVACRRQGDQMLLQVRNSGSWQGSGCGGYGLEFIRRQLQLHYGDAAQLTASSENGLVTVTLSLPIQGGATTPRSFG
ncbi:hypothetical protein SynWH8101_2492 [Synechococcus sp. WH 8101]|uniref:sensor histidine kinase n=1 Tax=Synechococcus sp. WH 8101 TaxID=59932 RepID=UPI001023613F|nr:histidine kinase [Synechococcus sp. WH 8101]QBE70064.1 hypothetical protein SynWH8101_2492 [Synechococcus sp. WH 8101]QNI46330.1 two-component system sensor histidine kinase [Synechococcus sp. WH 8101]